VLIGSTNLREVSTGNLKPLKPNITGTGSHTDQSGPLIRVRTQLSHEQCLQDGKVSLAYAALLANFRI
jgi:hypothetical protein